MSSFLTPEEAELYTETTLKEVSSKDLISQEIDQDADNPQESKPDPVIPLTDDYVLLSEIGHGGFGTVYKAKHKKIDKTVALKIINSDLIADATAVKRFEQEASSASNLTHANLAAVYDHGRTANGAPFLVMDFIDGTSLSNILQDEGCIKPIRALDILIQLCDALEHAHQKGVIHRDIKPNNIILSGSDQDSVKIIDFGIAKVLTAPKMDVNRITQTTQILGSPAYMSPEQCLGLKLDARSDIYSLGCVMYEMLTGKPPFLGVNPVQTVVKQINDQPAPFGLEESDRTLKELAALTLKCLSKKPEQRVQTMGKLATALRRVKSGKTAAIFPRRARNMITNGLLAILSLSLLAVFKLQQAPSPAIPEVATLVKDEIVAKPGQPFPIFDAHGKVLFVSADSHNLREALADAATRKIDLAGANLSHANLGIDESAGMSVIEGLNLAGADFTGSNLAGRTLRKCNLSHAVFKGTAFSPIYTEGTKGPLLFEDCNLTDAQFVGIGCERRSFKSTNFKDAKFEGASMDNCQFEDCNLSNVSITYSQLNYNVFQNCDLTYTRLTNSTLWGSTFPQATVVHTDFSDSTLLNVNLQEAKKTENIVLKNVRDIPLFVSKDR